MDVVLVLLTDMASNPAVMAAVNLFVPVLVGALLVWLIAKGLATQWAKSRKRQEMQLRAADSLTRLYGDIASAGKSWTAAHQDKAATECEALTLQLCSARTLSKPEMLALQAIRQTVLDPRDAAAVADLAKFRECASLLARALGSMAGGALPTVKLALKQLHEATTVKPVTPPVKKPDAPAVAAPVPAAAAVKAPVAAIAPVAATVPKLDVAENV